MKTADGKDVFSAAEFSAVEQAAIDWFADKDADYARGKFLTDSRYDAETARAVLDMAKGKCSSLADLEQSCRLYLLPGRAHGQGRGCGGIVGDTQIIVDWVERGVAPFEVKSPLRGGGELSVKPYPHNWTPKAALGCAMRNI